MAAHRDREGEERQGDADGGTRWHGVAAHEEGEVERVAAIQFIQRWGKPLCCIKESR